MAGRPESSYASRSPGAERLFRHWAPGRFLCNIIGYLEKKD